LDPRLEAELSDSIDPDFIIQMISHSLTKDDVNKYGNYFVSKIVTLASEHDSPIIQRRWMNLKQHADDYDIPEYFAKVLIKKIDEILLIKEYTISFHLTRLLMNNVV